jgi:hypothetical protein
VSNGLNFHTISPFRVSTGVSGIKALLFSLLFSAKVSSWALSLSIPVTITASLPAFFTSSAIALSFSLISAGRFSE